MKNHVVDTYENYKEENRLTTNNARRIEYETTVRVMEELIGTDKKILDCAAGTGIYAFHFADRGHEVTATDITPRHVEIMDKKLQEKSYEMQTAVLDAVDMSMFEDETFDVVFNMGPFYHLVDEEQFNFFICLLKFFPTLKNVIILEMLNETIGLNECQKFLSLLCFNCYMTNT